MKETIAYYNKETGALLDHFEASDQSWNGVLNSEKTFDVSPDNFIPIYPLEMKRDTLSLLDIGVEKLGPIMMALEAFSRGAIGQFGNMIECIMPKGKYLSWEDSNELEKMIRTFLDERQIEFKKSEATETTWELYRTIREFAAVKRNRGYWGWTVDFDGPIDKTLFKTDFDRFTDIKIVDREIVKRMSESEGVSVWDIVKEKLPLLPRGSRTQIIPVKDDNLVEGLYYIVRIHKPQKELSKI